MAKNQTDPKIRGIWPNLIMIFLFGSLVIWYVIDPDVFIELAKSIGGPISGPLSK